MGYRYKLGIDFGTTNSSIALRYAPEMKDLETVVFDADPHNKGMESLLPSLLYLDEEGRELVGVDALRASSLAGPELNHKLIRTIKLELDRAQEDVKFITIGAKDYYISDIIALILQRMMEEVGSLSVQIDGVVFGHPVDYNDKCKQVMVEAAYKAGIYATLGEARKKTVFVAEPVAVALDYAIDLREEKTIFVFDFGGGTLDTTIMKLKVQNEDDIFKPHEAIAKDRLTVGGELFTEELFKHGFLNKYGIEKFLKDFHIKEKLDRNELWDYLLENKMGIMFIQEMDWVKRMLSKRSNEILSFIKTDSDGTQYIIEQELTAQDFEDSIDHHFHDITESIKACLDLAKKKGGVEKKDIDVVLLAGGSSTIPCIVKLVKEVFGNDRVIEPKKNQQLTSIVKGLAIAGLREGDSRLLEDIVESNYGIYDSLNENVAVIIPRGTKISDTEFDKETLIGGAYDEFVAINDKVPLIRIFQNGDELGYFTLPEYGSGSYRVYFKVDEDKGWLSVYIYDIAANKWLEGDKDFDGNNCVFFMDSLLA